MRSPRLVAEVSSNHDASLARALAFVDAAADCGAHAVKFQQFEIERLFAPEALAASPELRARKAWELPAAFNPELAARAHARRLLFASTPFHLGAVDQLAPWVDFFKVASYQVLWLELLRAVARTGRPVVLATGMAELDEVRAAVEEHGGALVWGANFSLGVHLLYRLVDRAAELFAPLAGYDPFVEEAHHKGKRDSPSGTARELTRRLGERYGDRPLPVASLRAGHIPGTHRVGFDSAADTVVIEHRARSRRGFAEGALVAARWIAGRRGVFEFGTVLDDLLSIRGGT
jgi:hypothetical protein